MRRALLTITVAMSLVSLSWLTPAVVLHAADDLVLTRFGEYLDSVRSQAGVPALAATIVGPADVQWERAFGLRNVESAIATLPDTPFHLDGLTQLLTASMVLHCVEEGRLTLDDRIGTYAPTFSEPNATLRQLLTHTSGPPDNLVFSYRPSRIDILAAALSSCTGESYRAWLGTTLERLIMFDSVPGPDVLQLAPPNPFPSATIDRYRGILGRLASPYAVDAQGRPSLSRYAATTLTPSTGLISTVRDMAKFDLALKRGWLRADTLARAWTAPDGRLGQSLPHGLGWFVQSYAGEPVVWQFGVGDNSSSSMVITLPRRGLTLILLANSDGLVKRFPLAAGDLTVSPFGRLFLGVFVR